MWAAMRLGIGLSSIYYYERGFKGERAIVIPMHIALACKALEDGLVPEGER